MSVNIVADVIPPVCAENYISLLFIVVFQLVIYG